MTLHFIIVFSYTSIFIMYLLVNNSPFMTFITIFYLFLSYLAIILPNLTIAKGDIPCYDCIISRGISPGGCKNGETAGSDKIPGRLNLENGICETPCS